MFLHLIWKKIEENSQLAIFLCHPLLIFVVVVVSQPGKSKLDVFVQDVQKKSSSSYFPLCIGALKHCLKGTEGDHFLSHFHAVHLAMTLPKYEVV